MTQNGEVIIEKKLLVRLKDAVSGAMQGGRGTYRILIDEETCGARNLSMLMNTLQGGTKTAAHRHEEESCFYILAGRGTMYIGDRPFEAAPQSALFIPAGKTHRIDASPGEDLTYIMIYAPGGPERELKTHGAYGSSSGSPPPVKT